MAVRTILQIGDPRLLARSLPVTDFGTAFLGQLVRDMFDTMRANNGVGLAAPQIGQLLRVIVFGSENNSRYPDAPPVPETVLINPTVAGVGKELDAGWEGCLSVPGLRGQVTRFLAVRYTGYTLQGDLIERIAAGFHARVVQHECDHLEGILYTTKVSGIRSFNGDGVVRNGAAQLTDMRDLPLPTEG